MLKLVPEIKFEGKFEKYREIQVIHFSKILEKI